MLSAQPDTSTVVNALLEHDFDPVAAANTLGLCPTELIHWYRDPAARQALADIESFQLQLARLQALKFRRAATAELASLFTDAEATRPQRLRAAIALLRPDRTFATTTTRATDSNNPAARDPATPPPPSTTDHAPRRTSARRATTLPAHSTPPIAPTPAPPAHADNSAALADDPTTLDPDFFTPHAAYLDRVRALQLTGEPPALALTSHSDTQTPAACSPTQSGRSPPA